MILLASQLRKECNVSFIQFQIYNRINDKLVGLLIRARRCDLLDFEGEMFYQSRDDEKWIVLSKSLNSIHAHFGRDTNVPGGGEVDPRVEEGRVFVTSSSCCSADTDTDSALESLRNSKTSICSLPATISSSRALSVAQVAPGPEIQFDHSGDISEESPTETESRDSFLEVARH